MRGSHRHGCVNVESPVYQKVDAGFGGRRLETQVKLCAGRLSHFLGAPMYWSTFDSQTNPRLVEEAGLHIVSAREETAEEFGEPTTFLWIVARKR
jgi:hypothetical protein